MSKLAPVFGVSATLVSNACKEHHIPTPPRGYWSKVRAGCKLSKPKLPNRPLGMPNTVRLGRPRRIERAPQTCEGETLEDVRKRVTAAINRQNRQEPQQSADGTRSERMWNLLAGALAGFEGKVLVEPDQPSKVIVKVYHQRVAVWILDIEASIRADRTNNAIASKSLQICMAQRAFSKEMWRTWQDEDGTPIEARILEIATEIIVCAEMQQRMADAQIVEKQFVALQTHDPVQVEEKNAEPAIKRGEQIAAVAALLNQARDYESSKSLLRLLEAVQRTFPSNEDAEITRWCDLIFAVIQSRKPLENVQFLEAPTDLTAPDANIDRAVCLQHQRPRSRKSS
jgi:cell pole-organizing protein PopZ